MVCWDCRASKFGDNLAKISPSSNGFRESVQKAKLEAEKAKALEEKERDRIEKDWRLHHPIQATLRDWRKGVSDFLDEHTSGMKDDPNWKWLKGFGDAAFGFLGDMTFGVLEFGVDLLQYSTEGVILGYNSLMGNETPQWMKDDLQGGIETFGNVILNTLGNAFGLVTMIPEVNNLINDLDNSTRDSSIMGAILHDVRHAKDLKQKPIHDKFNKAAQFSGYDSGYAAGEIVSEIVSWIGPAKLFKMAGGSKLVSRLAQMPKIQKGISYFRKARTALANSHLGMLARESYGATKNFFTSRFGNLWDDFSRTKFAFAGLDDFHYADDIGKHTARLYQSTSEGAEYQRLRQKLYSEAAEHGDDVAKGLEEFVDGKFTDPEVQARYEKYLKKKAKQGKTPREPLDWKETSDRMAKIRNQGRQYELERLEDFKKIATDVEEQITIDVEAPDGEIVRTRVDAMGYDKETGQLLIQEYKSSATAPLTPNQKKAFQLIKDGANAHVVGKGKGVFRGGFEIPPGTEIPVIRPD